MAAGRPVWRPPQPPSRRAGGVQGGCRLGREEVVQGDPRGAAESGLWKALHLAGLKLTVFKSIF